MEEPKKSGWGGARAGAGRKKGVPTNRPVLKPHNISAAITPEALVRGKSMACELGISFSSLIDLLLKKGIIPEK